MGSTVKEVKSYRKGCMITETIVDGDLYKITEEYRDNKGNVVYIYEYFPTVEEILAHYNKSKKITPVEWLKKQKAETEEEKKEKCQKINKEIHKQKVNKKLEKNRKRG